MYETATHLKLFIQRVSIAIRVKLLMRLDVCKVFTFITVTGNPVKGRRNPPLGGRYCIDLMTQKIVMDVKNWETSLKATEGLLIVTGSQGALTFKRDFDLPGLKDPSQINASMSEDGVLTISVNIL